MTKISEVRVTSNFLSVARGVYRGKRIVAEEGSMRSGKTYAVMQNLIWMGRDLRGWIRHVAKWDGKSESEVEKGLRFLLNKKNGFTIKAFRKKSTTARQSIWKDAKRILLDFGWYDECAINETMMTIVFPNGNEFMCCGADEPDKYHSVAQDVVYFCELIDFKEEVFEQINGRTTFCVIVDWNPRSSRHWAYKKILNRPASEMQYHHSTYKDNPFLEESQIKEIENWKPTAENYEKGTADAWLWQVYGLGKRGVRQGVIFDPRKWEIVPDNAYPSLTACLRHGYGLDFGFSSDPTALIECSLSNDALYLREVIYETGLLVQKNPNVSWQKSVVGILEEKNFSTNTRIIADSAVPEAISQLKFSGYNVLGARKANGSVVEGLERLRARKIYVTESSLGLQFELENYAWKVNSRTGEVLDIPEDKNNHAIDAVRYWSLENLNPSQTGQYRVQGKNNGVFKGRKTYKW
jgi:phage terminase large subunit